jgi:hypothetical protein
VRVREYLRSCITARLLHNAIKKLNKRKWRNCPHEHRSVARDHAAQWAPGWCTSKALFIKRLFLGGLVGPMLINPNVTFF